MRRWIKVFLAKKSGKVGGAILVSDRTDVKTDSNKRQKRTLYNDQEFNPETDVTVVNINAPNTGA